MKAKVKATGEIVEVSMESDNLQTLEKLFSERKKERLIGMMK